MSDSSIIGQHRYQTTGPLYVWRYFHTGLCPKHEKMALLGELHTVFHSSLLPEAFCKNGDSRAYVTHCAEEPWPFPSKHPDHPSPYEGCTCGYFALFRPDPVLYRSRVAVWCQAIGMTEIAEFGIRTQQLRLLAGFLPHEHQPKHLSWAADILTNLGVPVADPAEAPALLQAMNIPFSAEELYRPRADHELAGID